MSLNQGL